MDESEPRADWLELPPSPLISWPLGGVSVRVDVQCVALRGEWQESGGTGGQKCNKKRSNAPPADVPRQTDEDSAGLWRLKARMNGTR